jgi:hypothetical protein
MVGARVALRLDVSSGAIRVSFDKGVDRLNIFVRNQGTKMAELDDTRRDLQLMIVTWGLIKGEDRSELSRGQ